MKHHQPHASSSIRNVDSAMGCNPTLVRSEYRRIIVQIENSRMAARRKTSRASRRRPTGANGRSLDGPGQPFFFTLRRRRFGPARPHHPRAGDGKFALVRCVRLVLAPAAWPRPRRIRNPKVGAPLNQPRLLTIFFFLVGLEIKRDLVCGEPRDPRNAVLPAAAAPGGMVEPVTTYLLPSHGNPGADGWSSAPSQSM